MGSALFSNQQDSSGQSSMSSLFNRQQQRATAPMPNDQMSSLRARTQADAQSPGAFGDRPDMTKEEYRDQALNATQGGGAVQGPGAMPMPQQRGGAFGTLLPTGQGVPQQVTGGAFATSLPAQRPMFQSMSPYQPMYPGGGAFGYGGGYMGGGGYGMMQPRQGGFTSPGAFGGGNPYSGGYGGGYGMDYRPRSGGAFGFSPYSTMGGGGK